jgi:2-C-methyl-D-erythritol 2,4-cyclodiphosphate synthase
MKYIEDMETNIAEALDIPKTSVNVKATTTEGLGFIGNKEGIAALATCTIIK